MILCRGQSHQSKDTPNVNEPQSYMELDPQTRQYEHSYQQPATTDSNTSQAYMDLNPQTREGTKAYQELHKGIKSPQGAESEAYEEIKEADTKQQVYQEVADNNLKEESQTYVNVNPERHRQARRK